MSRETELSYEQMLAAKDAEIASLKANRDRWKAIALMYNTKYSEGTVEITALKAERDALKVDAERLDWVALQDLSEFDIQFIFDAPHEGEYSVGTEYGTFYGLTLREAIDAAMAKAEKP